MTDPTPTLDEAVPFPAYGELPFSELGSAVKAAQFGAPAPYEFDPEFYPGHQIVGTINFNSLNRIVTWFVMRALASAPAPASGGVDAGAQLAEIEAMLSDGQGDDDGPQILPDFEPGWSTVAKVEACLHLLEKRRDALVGAPQPHANMTVSALARARDVMSAVADKVEHQGLTVQAQILRRQADDIRGTLDVLIRSEERA